VSDEAGKEIREDCQPDTCSPSPNDHPEQFCTPEIQNQDASVVMPAYNFRDLFDSLVAKQKIKHIEEKLQGKTFKYEFNCQYFLKKISGDDLVDNYLTKMGEIVTVSITSQTIIIILHNDFLHKFTIDLSTYTDVHVLTCTNNIDGVNDEYEYINQQFKKILRPTIERASLEWGAMLDGKVKFFRLEEDLDDIFHNEAYPYIDIEKLTKEFYESSSPILIFLGPPGTGKTRLIRNILKHKASLNRKSKVECIFTSDQKIIEDGFIFTNFLTGNYDILVLEDIDFHLTPRTDGNTSMYHLLNISNGIASNYMKHKKIILSTNLPNINNIDTALMRPGRCFDIIKTRPLDKNESLILLKLIGKTTKLEDKKYPISELYNIDQKARKVTIKSRKGISKKAGF